MNQITKNVLWMLGGACIVLVIFGIVYIYQQQKLINTLSALNKEQGGMIDELSSDEEWHDESATQEDTILYINEEYGFSFYPQKDWEEYYHVRIHDIVLDSGEVLSGIKAISFYLYEGKPTFQIYAHDISTLDSLIKTGIDGERFLNQYLGRNDKWFFTIVGPYDVPPKQGVEPFDSDKIKSTFKAF